MKLAVLFAVGTLMVLAVSAYENPEEPLKDAVERDITTLKRGRNIRR